MQKSGSKFLVFQVNVTLIGSANVPMRARKHHEVLVSFFGYTDAFEKGLTTFSFWQDLKCQVGKGNASYCRLISKVNVIEALNLLCFRIWLEEFGH